LLFIDYSAAHLKNTTLLSKVRVVFLPANCSSQVQPLDFGIIHAFKCPYRKQLIQKTVAMMDTGLLHHAIRMKLHVLSVVFFIAEA
jgi:hypothetical protein